VRQTTFDLPAFPLSLGLLD